MNQRRCDKCNEKGSYFYQCACKQKNIKCRDCSVGKHGYYCPSCKRAYDRYDPKYSTEKQLKQLNSHNKHNSSGNKTAKKVQKSTEQHKKDFKAAQSYPLQSFKQSPILEKKPQRDHNRNKQDMLNREIKKSQMLLNPGFPDRKDFKQKFNNKQWPKSYEKQQPQTKKFTSSGDENYFLTYKQQQKITTKPLTKEEQLKEILRNLQKNKGYFDVKCQKLYKLHQFAQLVDQNKWSSIFKLPNCNCQQKKQFVLVLLKDRCLICAGQRKYQNQRYELKNGFCICNHCQVFFQSQEQNAKSYIRPLLYQCLTCQYNQIKRTKKEMHDPQNNDKDGVTVCELCYKTSINKENRIIQEKQRKLKIEQQKRRREEQPRQKKIESQRRKEQIQNHNKKVLEKIEEDHFKYQLKMIQEMQQRDKRERERKQRLEKQQKRRKQEEQKRRQKKEQQKTKKYENERITYQPIGNKQIYNVRSDRQKEIRTTFRSSDSISSGSKSCKCVACDRVITSYQKGAQIYGVLICSLCRIKNNSQCWFQKVSEDPSIGEQNDKKVEIKKIIGTENEKLNDNELPNIQQFNSLNRNIIREQLNNFKGSNVRKFKKSEINDNFREDQNKKLEKKGKKQKKQESSEMQKQLKLSQNIMKQSIDKKENNKDFAKVCGECNSYIDSIEKLGLKNEDGLILCSKCFELQKSRIQNGGKSLPNIQNEGQNKVSISEKFSLSVFDRSHPDSKRRQEENNRKKNENLLQKQFQYPIRQEQKHKKEVKNKTIESQLNQQMIAKQQSIINLINDINQNQHLEYPNSTSIVIEISKLDWGREQYEEFPRIESNQTSHDIYPSSNQQNSRIDDSNIQQSTMLSEETMNETTLFEPIIQLNPSTPNENSEPCQLLVNQLSTFKSQSIIPSNEENPQMFMKLNQIFVENDSNQIARFMNNQHEELIIRVLGALLKEIGNRVFVQSINKNLDSKSLIVYYQNGNLYSRIELFKCLFSILNSVQRIQKKSQ